MNEPRSKGKIILVTAMLLLFFFVAPFGSWYYLQKGWDFQKQQIEALQPKGELDLSGFDHISKSDLDSLKTKSLIIGLELGNENRDLLREQINSLTEQFGERIELGIISLSEMIGNRDSISGQFFRNTETSQIWTAVQTSEKILESGINSDVDSKAYFALIDSEGLIRNYYSLDEMEDLVVHTAMLLPVNKREKINLKRDQEK